MNISKWINTSKYVYQQKSIQNKDQHFAQREMKKKYRNKDYWKLERIENQKQPNNIQI